jgi:hypothetical protein
MNTNSSNSKAKKSIFPLDNLTLLLNDKTDPLEQLDSLYAAIENKAREMIVWYLNKRRFPSLCSRFLRFLAIMLASFGGLCPLLQHIGDYNLNQWGYFSFGLAAAILGLDKFFGFSSAWMRYMLMQMSLQKKFANFQLEWLKRRCFVTKDLSQEEVESLFMFLQNFQVDFLTEVEQEVHSWVIEFQSNLVQLNKMGKNDATNSAKK